MLCRRVRLCRAGLLPASLRPLGLDRPQPGDRSPRRFRHPVGAQRARGDRRGGSCVVDLSRPAVFQISVDRCGALHDRLRGQLRAGRLARGFADPVPHAGDAGAPPPRPAGIRVRQPRGNGADDRNLCRRRGRQLLEGRSHHRLRRRQRDRHHRAPAAVRTGLCRPQRHAARPGWRNQQLRRAARAGRDPRAPRQP